MLVVAAGEMQMRIRVIKMDGNSEEEVEIQIVGEDGPMISVALYTKTQHVKALIDTWQHYPAAAEGEEETRYKNETSEARINTNIGNRNETKCEARVRRWTAELQRREMEAVEDSELTRKYKSER